MKLGTCPYRKLLRSPSRMSYMQTNQSPNLLGALPESENEIRRCTRRPCFCVRYKAYDSPSHVSCLRCPRIPRKYSFFLSGRLAVQHDDVWTERIANMNKESSSRLERGWGSKALDLKTTSTWRLKVTLETSGEQHMKKLTFKQLPPIVKIGLGIVFYNAWWSSKNLSSTVMSYGNICPTTRWVILVFGT